MNRVVDITDTSKYHNLILTCDPIRFNISCTDNIYLYREMDSDNILN